MELEPYDDVTVTSDVINYTVSIPFEASLISPTILGRVARPPLSGQFFSIFSRNLIVVKYYLYMYFLF